MKTLAHEPRTEYKVSGWPRLPEIYPHDKYVFDYENGILTLYRPSSSIQPLLIERKTKKLSSLRGKMTKQNEKEIDDQILHLRDEWKRNI